MIVAIAFSFNIASLALSQDEESLTNIGEALAVINKVLKVAELIPQSSPTLCLSESGHVRA